MIKFRFVITIYGLLTLVLTVYWAYNWQKYVHIKGDEFFFFVEYLLALTIAFHLSQIILIRQLKYLMLLLAPFATIFSTLILGMFFLAVSGMGDTATLNLYIYGIIYAVTNIIVSVLIAIRLKNSTNIFG